jgi:hypothetical protein
MISKKKESQARSNGPGQHSAGPARIRPGARGGRSLNGLTGGAWPSVAATAQNYMERPGPFDQVRIDSPGLSPTSSRVNRGRNPSWARILQGLTSGASRSMRRWLGSTTLDDKPGDGQHWWARGQDADLHDGHGVVHFGGAQGLGSDVPGSNKR